MITRRLVALLALAASACSSPAPRPPPGPGSVVSAPAVDATPPVAKTDGPPSAPEAPPPPIPVAIDAALARRVDAAIDHSINSGRGVGVVVMIARDGTIVYQRAAGYADREAKRAVKLDTQFRLASMTKPITCAAALALVDQGKLSLDDPVTKWIPEFRPKLADGSEPAITIRQLMTHTSGLSYRFTETKLDGPYHQANVSDGLAEPALSMKENLQRLVSVPLVAKPGSKWHYGLSIDVLGEVMARASGDELPTLIARLVTRPAGMIDTIFYVTARDRLAWPYGDGRPPERMGDPYERTEDGMTVKYAPSRVFDSASFASGGAGMVGTAIDYLRFAELLRTGGGAVLPPARAKEMVTNQVGKERSGRGRGYGFGVGVIVETGAIAKKPWRKAGTFGWGGIYGTNFWVDPDAKLTVIFLTNHAGQSPLFDDVESAIYDGPPPAP